MPLYEALEPVYVGTEFYPTGRPFRSDAVPGRAWKPLDAEAEAAVKAAAAARPTPAPAKDPKVAELEAELEKAWAEVEDLKAQVAKFDGNGDGKVGGSKPK